MTWLSVNIDVKSLQVSAASRQPSERLEGDLRFTALKAGQGAKS